MNTTTINDKWVIHVPHFAFIDGKLEGVDATGFKKDLYQLFDDNCITSWYSNMVNAAYNGREYEEEIITLYRTPFPMVDEFIYGLQGLLKKWHKELKQEAYAYECKDKLYIITL